MCEIITDADGSNNNSAQHCLATVHNYSVKLEFHGTSFPCCIYEETAVVEFSLHSAAQVQTHHWLCSQLQCSIIRFLIQKRDFLRFVSSCIIMFSRTLPTDLKILVKGVSQLYSILDRRLVN